MRTHDVGIIGYGTAVYEKKATRTEMGYLAEAAKFALASARVAKDEIDGIVVSSTTLQPDNAVTLAEYFGLSVTWASMSTAGGAGAPVNVLDAAQAVASGRAKNVLCLAGAAQDGAFFRDRMMRFNSSFAQYLTPHGCGGTNGLFGIIQRKHMETYGTTRRQLGRIALDQRANAQKNEGALLRADMTIDDYLNAMMIADPLGLFDCVMPCSGAEAILVGPIDRAPKGKGVRILSGRERHNHPPGEVTPLRGGWETFRDSLYDEAGYGPGDMQFVQIYDDYPIMVAIQLEDLGFAKKGEIGPFLERTRLTFDGDLPINTGGGGGMIGITEAVRQLRGEGGARQVKGATRGLVSGYGMVAYGHGLSSSALVLETVS